MAVLSWGKPLVEISDSGENPTFVALVGTIVEGSAQLATNKGNKKEAKGAGGDTVDVRYDKSSYVFSLEIYVKKGETPSLSDTDGVVAGNKAVRLTPEDDTLEGFLMPVSVANVEVTYSDNDGKRLKYTFDGIKPSSGNTVQGYTKAVAQG